MLEVISNQITPEFVEYSTLIGVTVPVEVHVMVAFELATRFSPPFGDVTVKLGAAAVLIVKAALLTSF